MAFNWLLNGLMIGALLLAACSEAPAQNSDDSSGTNDNGAAAGIIAFVSSRDGAAEVYRMNADGSEQTRLTHVTERHFLDMGPTLSPDGRRIALSRIGVLFKRSS